MGVPAFYRWISEKYSKIVVEILEQRPPIIEGQILPLNLNEPNPNNLEFDNLYIDMNGLIHPCSHPEDREAPKTEAEMYMNCMKYVDRLVAAVRPRKLLFLAIDGVAPRAKMNQQRSRRFRSAQDAKQRKEVYAEVKQEMADLGYKFTEEETEDDAWDSNVITTGTEFMTKISMFLRFYILDRMNKDKYWRRIKVIVSDANEPGEGEHKIMNYIRSQRNQPDYDPNTHHVLHGLDADLIMLALATHEIRFTILREKVFFGKNNQNLDQRSDAQRLLDEQSMLNGVKFSCLHPEDEWIYKKPLEALHVFILREYLQDEFASLQTILPFTYDFERVIDDFIFLCFFVGNDFLPHLPSLDIRDGALDFLMECYKDVLPSLGDYLTSPGGNINLLQADVILSRVGEVEDQIFQRKKQAETESERRMENRRQYQNNNNNNNNNFNRNNSNASNPPPSITNPTLSRSNSSTLTADIQAIAISSTDSTTKNFQAADALRNSLLGKRSSDETSTPKDELSELKKAKLVALLPESTTETSGSNEDNEDNEINPEFEASNSALEIKKKLKLRENERLDALKKPL